MKIKNKYILIIILIISSLLYFGYHSKLWIILFDPIQYHSAANRPKGYYVPLVNNSFPINTKNRTKEYKFTLKYSGKYTYGIVFEGAKGGSIFDDVLLGKTNLSKDSLVIEVVFTVDGNNISKIVVLKKGNIFSYGKNEEGISLDWFSVPEFLPQKKEIELTVKVISPSENLFKNYGPTRFILRKLSDE